MRSTRTGLIAIAVMTLGVVLALFAGPGVPLVWAEDAPPGAVSPIVTPSRYERLSVEPDAIVLVGENDSAQLLVTAHGSDGSERDVTHQATYQVLEGQTVTVVDGRLTPAATGGCRLHITVHQPEGSIAPADLILDLPVMVEQFAEARPINFANDIVPILSKYGCNSGACHGKATGQNGFHLSLLGFNAAADYDAIVKEARGRRVFPAAPEKSLLLTKATAASVHGGGRRFAADSPPALLLQSWIEQGMPRGKADDPVVVGVSVSPQERLLPRQTSQQLRVVARYSDGVRKDVTADCHFQAQQPDLATVTPQGLATTLDSTGDATVMVRYAGMVDVVRLTIPVGSIPSEGAYADFHPKGKIDELVLAKWRKLGIAPSPRCTDQEFLRRASLDAIGTLPTPDEVRQFMADGSPDKRERLIDRLLERNEYAGYWSHIWCDLLRNKRSGDESKRGTFAFSSWVREAFSSNMPYDQFVTAIITAQGSTTENPPVNWYRQARNVVHQVNDTSQLFLGTRINCANCHHHPYERWSQDDYWGLASFFSRLGSKAGQNQSENLIFVQKDGSNLPGEATRRQPKALGGAEYEMHRGEDPRQDLAAWLARDDNPYFARAMSNRMWAHFFGVGLVEAVDDMRVTNPPSNPELLEALAADFLAHRFDIKQLLRSIMTCETYGLSSEPTPLNAKDRRNYARYYPKRMAAEVMADAIDAASGAMEKYPGMPQGTRAIDLPDEAVPSYFLDVFGRSHRETPCECERSYAPSLSQVLHLMNSGDIQNKLTNQQGRIAQMAAAGKTPQQMVEELYLAACSRMPEAGELSEASEYVAAAKDQKAALGDVMWVLLNTKEFMFNH